MAYVKLGADSLDCEQLAPSLRAIDLRECNAFREQDAEPLDVLRDALSHSEDTYSVIGDEGYCIAIFGVGSIDDDGGCPWLLASDELFDKHSKEFVKQCAGFAKRLARNYRWLFNYVAVENTKAIRWLEWLGFIVDRQTPTVFKGMTFYPFWYRK